MDLSGIGTEIENYTQNFIDKELTYKQSVLRNLQEFRQAAEECRSGLQLNFPFNFKLLWTLYSVSKDNFKVGLRITEISN